MNALINSFKYVVNENIQNIYRIFCIVKYEILAENRDSKLGMLWSVLDPLIQIFAYWFAFGMGIRGGKPVNGVEYINWMLVGLTPWFFLSAAIRKGTSAIQKKINIITKMKFPISILPTTVIFKELFNHVIMLFVVIIFILIKGVRLNLNLNSLSLIYYMFCAIVFSISLTMVTSVANMFTRDIGKAVNASMRLLMFITPILWTMEKLPKWAVTVMKCNPLFYIIEGYRNSLLFNKSIFLYSKRMLVFWIIVISLFSIGSLLMYKFKHKFIDLI